MSERSHSHGGQANRTRLTVALGITCGILLAEIVGAALTGSLALLVDAAHMFTDAGGLGLALFAAVLVTRAPTARRTWGFARAEIIAAMAQSAILLAVGIFVFVEAVGRLISPPEVPSAELIVFGAIGLLGNVVAIVVLVPGRNSGLSMRGAFLEVANDALGSVAVIVAAVVIGTTGWSRADAVAALLIGVLILPRTVRLLREALDVLLESVPTGLDLDAVRAHILAIPEVVAVHDLHASRIATGMPVLTAHVVVEDRCFYDGRISAITDDLQQCVSAHFDVAIEHSTFQLERAAHARHEHGAHD